MLYYYTILYHLNIIFSLFGGYPVISVAHPMGTLFSRRVLGGRCNRLGPAARSRKASDDDVLSMVSTIYIYIILYNYFHGSG